MSGVTLPFDRPRTVGAAEIGFRATETGTRLADLYQTDPLRVLFPRPGADEPPQAVLVTTSGGLVGGDRLTVDFRVGPEAAAGLVAQAAEKIYRSLGPAVEVEVRLKAGARGWLEWLPQETILFDGAVLDRRTVIDADPTARVLAGEMLVFGRRARGEVYAHGRVVDAWQVRVGGRLRWADRLCLDDPATVIGHPAGLGGAAAVASAVYVGADAAIWRDPARDLLAAGAAAGLRSGASVVNGMLIMRWLGDDAAVLRQSFGHFWAGFRHAVAGLPADLPRLWRM